MNKILLYLVLLIASTFLVSGQDNELIQGGTIRYEAFDKFDLSYFKDAEPEVMEWLSGMPKGAKTSKVLYFNNRYSLFEEDNTVVSAVLDKKALVMRSKMPYISAPRPELKKVFIDRDKGLMSTQKELMTRYFIIKEELVEWDWKPGANQVKILDYLCMSATATSGDKIVTAWFTPQVQTKAGPDLYGGLPGLILAVDINGENVLLATEVDLSSPGIEVFKAPSEGKTIKGEAFQKLVDEKMEQYRAELENESKMKYDKSEYHKEY